MSANDFSATVIDQVNEIVRRQPIIDGYQDRANLRDGIKGFQLGVRVRRNVSHSIPSGHAELLQNRRPAITSIEEFFVSQPQIAIHHGFAIAIELPRAPRKVHRGQRCFHLLSRTVPRYGVQKSRFPVYGLPGLGLFFSKDFSDFDFCCRQTSTSASVVMALRNLSEKVLARFSRLSKSIFPISLNAASGPKPGVAITA